MKHLYHFINEKLTLNKQSIVNDTRLYLKNKSFKNTSDLANIIGLYLQNYGDKIQKFVKILGKTVYDKGKDTEGRTIEVRQRHSKQLNSYIYLYLQKDWEGDYLEFKDKPTQNSLDKCSKILKDDLEEQGFFVNPEFYVLEHNYYYQHVDTYGVGIKIKVTKKDYDKCLKYNIDN